MDWRKSSRCGATECVEVAAIADVAVFVRDSQDHAGPVLALTPGAWRDLTLRVKGGDG